MRRFMRKRVRSKRKGYDWICTQGDQGITLLNPVANNTLAEFPLITPSEVQEIGGPLIVHRVVGTCWLDGPIRTATGDLNGIAQVAWGVRVATTDASGTLLYLPVDALSADGMDASWMFLRHQLLGVFNGGLAFPINHVPNVATGGGHAPQGGPCIDINTKRKMADTDVLTLSVSVGPLLNWVLTGVGTDYVAGDAVMTALHIRCLVSAVGR